MSLLRTSRKTVGGTASSMEFKDTDYAIYIDDIGSGKPGLRGDFPMFGLGGFLVKRQNEVTVVEALRNFKNSWNIKQNIPLHGSEIRSRKERYRWLRDDDRECKRFKAELLDMILALPIVVHGCIVDRVGYFNRYHGKYSRKPWDMRKSAALIVLERSVKFVKLQGGESLTAVFELCGKAEDDIFRECHRQLRELGNPFDSSNSAKYSPADVEDLSRILCPTAYAYGKENELLQIADACLFPLATSRNGKQNSAFNGFKISKLLVDELVSDPSVLGAKFYCFDGPQ
jgi:hypothetical protein